MASSATRSAPSKIKRPDLHLAIYARVRCLPRFPEASTYHSPGRYVSRLRDASRGPLHVTAAKEVTCQGASRALVHCCKEFDCLVEKGFLQPERRHNHAAIQSAIDGFICHEFGPSKSSGWRQRPMPTNPLRERPTSPMHLAQPICTARPQKKHRRSGAKFFIGAARSTPSWEVSVNEGRFSMAK
jgi:hypothetical protein